MATLLVRWRFRRRLAACCLPGNTQEELVGPVPPPLRVGVFGPAAFDRPGAVHWRLREDSFPLKSGPPCPPIHHASARPTCARTGPAPYAEPYRTCRL